MKLLFGLLFLFLSVLVESSLIEADKSFECQTNIQGKNWVIKLDYFWDGHPQNDSGWSAIAQINTWGKFPMIVDLNSQKLSGVSHGQDRLEGIDIELSTEESYIKRRYQLPYGNYTEWEKFDLKCKLKN